MPVIGRKEMAILEGLFHVPYYVEEEPKPRGESGFNYEQRIRGRGRMCWFEGCIIPRSPPPLLLNEVVADVWRSRQWPRPWSDV